MRNLDRIATALERIADSRDDDRRRAQARAEAHSGNWRRIFEDARAGRLGNRHTYRVAPDATERRRWI